jgi:uncharacterized spore protein YtfJ
MEDVMEDVERLLKGTVEELDRLLNARNVLGEPIEKDGATIIPMVSFGFGFGAGGGIKPLGAIIIDKDGPRLEAVRGAVTSLAEVLSETASKAFAARSAAAGGPSPSGDSG